MSDTIKPRLPDARKHESGSDTIDGRQIKSVEVAERAECHPVAAAAGAHRQYVGPSSGARWPSVRAAFVIESYREGGRGADTLDHLTVRLGPAGASLEYDEGDHGVSYEATVCVGADDWRALASWAQRMAADADPDRWAWERGAWAKGLTPPAIAQVARDYYTLHQDAVTAALNAIGIDPDPSVSLGSTVNQAMVNRIIEAALGDTDVEQIETGPLCDRITELDLGKVLAGFPKG